MSWNCTGMTGNNHVKRLRVNRLDARPVWQTECEKFPGWSYKERRRTEYNPDSRQKAHGAKTIRVLRCCGPNGSLATRILRLRFSRSVWKCVQLAGAFVGGWRL